MGKTSRQTKPKSSKKELFEEDDRFKDISRNPLFNEIPRKKRKVVADERFQQMFTDDRFKIGNSKVDKRGRKLDLSSNQHLADLYDIDQHEDKDSSSEEDNSDDSDTESNAIEIKLDLARGEGNVSSSSEEETDDEDLENEEVESQSNEDSAINSWGEMDRSVKRVEWASRRIAICNQDWDRLNAEDLLVVLNSFKPDAGCILSVGIYLSDFGADRLEKEETSGPVLPIMNVSVQDVDGSDRKTKDMIRAYQIERLQYYYAVCECDSEETAVAIYDGCDGVEYETSGMRFDLRFVPDSMEFEESRFREKISNDDLNMARYKPKRFESRALSNCNAQLTWDENDPERTLCVTEAFKGETNLDAFENLLAPPSDSEDSNEDDNMKKRDILLHDKSNSKMGDADLHVQWDTKEGSAEKESVSEENGGGSENSVGNPTIKMKSYKEYLERKKQIQKERKAEKLKQKREAKGISEPGNTRQRKSDSKVIEPLYDARFSALVTDSSFAIDKTHSQYKGSELADQQVEEKRRKSKKGSKSDGNNQEISAKIKEIEEGELSKDSTAALMENLKRKAKQMKSKV